MCIYGRTLRPQPEPQITTLIITLILCSNNDDNNMPSPSTKSLAFGGFDSRRLLILRGGNFHVRIIS